MKRILKNKAEREAWLNNFKAWGIWKEISELGLRYYKYDFANGDRIVVTSYVLPENKYRTAREAYRFCLILAPTSEYKPTYGQCYNYFEPNGHAKGTAIEYLTKMRPEVEIYEN